jgi:hypothetical protein
VSGSTPPDGGPVVVEKPHRSAVAGILLWLVIVGAVFGGGGFYAYKQGLIFAKPANAGSDSTSGDTTRLAATDSAHRGDSTATVTPPAPPSGPGHLVLQNLPTGARVTIDGQPVRGDQLDLPSGVRRLMVRAAGFQNYERSVIIQPGETSTLRVNMETSGEGGGPCDTFGPAYNQDNICFDSRPVPLSSTLIPVPADAPIFPRQAILLMKVSRDGATLESRVFVPSNVETFNNDALEMARRLRWNPAQKNGEPTEAWVQWPFQPVRQ